MLNPRRLSVSQPECCTNYGKIGNVHVYMYEHNTEEIERYDKALKTAVTHGSDMHYD